MTGTDVPTNASPHTRSPPASSTAARPRAIRRCRPTAGASPSSSPPSTSPRTRPRAGSGSPVPTARPGADHRRSPRRPARPGRRTVGGWPSGHGAARRTSESTLHVLPVDGPGEVRTVVAMPDGIANIAWSPDGRWLGFTSRTRDSALRGQGRALAGTAEGRDVLHPAGQRGLGVRPAPARLRRRRRRHRHRPQPDARPVPARRHRLARRLVGRGRRRGQRHEGWDLDLAPGPVRRPARRRDPRPDQADRDVHAPGGVTRRHARWRSSARRPDHLPAEQPGSAWSPCPAAAHRWISNASTARSRRRAACALPSGSTTTRLLAAAEDRGETHLYRLDRRRVRDHRSRSPVAR